MISEYTKKFIIVSTLFLLFDYIWLQFFKNLWGEMVSKIQLTNMKVKIKYAVPAYILMTLSVIIFVLPNIRDEYILKDSIIYGGLLGLIIYGIFDFTNLTVFTNYSLNLAIIDILWGTALFTIVSYISKKSLMYLKYII